MHAQELGRFREGGGARLKETADVGRGCGERDDPGVELDPCSCSGERELRELFVLCCEGDTREQDVVREVDREPRQDGDCGQSAPCSLGVVPRHREGRKKPAAWRRTAGVPCSSMTCAMSSRRRVSRVSPVWIASRACETRPAASSTAAACVPSSTAYRASSRAAASEMCPARSRMRPCHVSNIWKAHPWWSRCAAARPSAAIPIASSTWSAPLSNSPCHM